MEFFSKKLENASSPLPLIGVLLVSYYLLVFSEKRSIYYYLAGNRSISFSDVFFLLSNIALFSLIFFKKGWRLFLISSGKSILHIILPLFLLLVIFLAPARVSSHSITAFMLLGGTIFMLLSYLLFLLINDSDIFVHVYWYAIIMAVALFIHSIIMIILGKSAYLKHTFSFLLYGEGTPALHQPFNSPSQMALFGSIVMLMGAGSALSLGRFKALYFLIPAMFIAIGQTGSRSVMLLSVAAWILYMGLYPLNFRYNTKKIKTGIVYALLSSIIAVVALVASMDRVTERSLSLMSVSPKSIVTGEVDKNFRGHVWKKEFESSPLGSNNKKVIGSTHNIYLDFLVVRGILGLSCFSLFLILLLGEMVLSVICRTKTAGFPFYLSILISLLVVVGEFYANPVLHLRFVWVFFGLTVAMILKKRVDNSIQIPTG